MNELQISIEVLDECLRLRTILLAVGGAVMIVRIRSGPNLKEGEPAISDNFVFFLGGSKSSLARQNKFLASSLSMWRMSPKMLQSLYKSVEHEKRLLTLACTL